MSTFEKKLTCLLNDAANEKIIDEPTVNRLRQLAYDREQSHGVLTLAAVLGWLGGGILGLGIILFISAHWESIPDVAKIIGFVALLAGVHFAGLWLRWHTNLKWIAESLSFLGAIIFLAGIGLISQIFHLDGRPPNAVLMWLVAIVPLAWALRSGPITLLSVFALMLWLHMEQFSWGSRLWRISPATIFLIDTGVGVALIGLTSLIRERQPTIAWVFRGCGVLLLFAGVYMLGFYRHISFDTLSNHHSVEWLTCLAPAGALLFGAVGLAAGYFFMLPNNPRLRDQLTILLASLLALGFAILGVELGILPNGPELRFFNFGWYREFSLMVLLLSLVAWVLWFLLALWCVLFAARTGRKAYLNAGVLGVGLGVLTRFFDLAGGLMETSLLFIVGGGALLITCFAVEFWRRRILETLKQSDVFQQGVGS